MTAIKLQKIRNYRSCLSFSRELPSQALANELLALWAFIIIIRIKLLLFKIQQREARSLLDVALLTAGLTCNQWRKSPASDEIKTGYVVIVLTFPLHICCKIFCSTFFRL